MKLRTFAHSRYLLPNCMAMVASRKDQGLADGVRDHLTRFGFKYIETLLATRGRSIEVVNVTENPIEDNIADFVSILYSFCAKLYGQRRARYGASPEVEKGLLGSCASNAGNAQKRERRNGSPKR